MGLCFWGFLCGSAGAWGRAFLVSSLSHGVLSLLTGGTQVPIGRVTRRITLADPTISDHVRGLRASNVVDNCAIILGHPTSHICISTLVDLSIAPDRQSRLIRLVRGDGRILRYCRIANTCAFLVGIDYNDVPRLRRLVLRFRGLNAADARVVLSAPIGRNSLRTLRLWTIREAIAATIRSSNLPNHVPSAEPPFDNYVGTPGSKRASRSRPTFIEQGRLQP